MSSRNNYGQRRVEVTAAVIEAWMVNENRVRTDLPDDARFVRMYPDDKGCYYFVFESSEWDELQEAETIPKIQPEVERPSPKVTIQK